MARLLGFAAAAALAAPLAVAQVDLASLGANTACRSSADPAEQCRESATQSCRDKYDVLTQTTLQDCKTVCETLAATCTGIEWLTPGSGSQGRCEIWKAPIEATVSATNYECYEDQDNTTGTDGALYVYWELELPTANMSIVSQLDATGTALVTAALKNGVVAGYGLTSGATRVAGVAASDVSLEYDWAGGVARVLVAPPTGANPLVMYAVLRPSSLDQKDGNAPIGDNMTDALTAQLTPFNAVTPFLNAGETSAVVRIKSYSRRLLTSDPFTPAPTPAPTPGPTPTPTPRSVNGAKGCRLALASLVASVLAGAVARF